jgi:Tfp pilus assembly protein PilV
VRSLPTEERGLTLAEVLPALALLSIGLVAMITLLGPAATSIHEGEHRSRAIFLASQRLEQIRHAVGRSEIDTDPLLETGAFTDEPTLSVPHADFSRSVRILDCGLPSGCSSVQSLGMRQVSVTVGYPGAVAGAGAAHRGIVVLTTYIGPR